MVVAEKPRGQGDSRGYLWAAVIALALFAAPIAVPVICLDMEISTFLWVWLGLSIFHLALLLFFGTKFALEGIQFTFALSIFAACMLYAFQVGKEELSRVRGYEKSEAPDHATSVTP